MPLRSRKEELKYARYKKQRPVLKASCQFCSLSEGEEVIKESESFILIKNMFRYSLWDEQEVIDHLLLIPKLHTPSLQDFTEPMRGEYMRLLAEYETHGYSNYSRSPKNISKTVTHYHTHLIKLSGQHKTFIFYAKRPYVRIAH